VQPLCGCPAKPGASGVIGQQLIAALAVQYPDWSLIASDIRALAEQWLKPNVESLLLDISQPAAGHERGA
jgi:UDP-glucose 4-epimerase